MHSSQIQAAVLQLNRTKKFSEIIVSGLTGGSTKKMPMVGVVSLPYEAPDPGIADENGIFHMFKGASNLHNALF